MRVRAGGRSCRRAVDELERLVGTAYRPGARLGRPRSADEAALLTAHAACASALLTAFEITGRLPYAMLAEELVQPLTAIRLGLHAALPSTVNCEAARVLCRLAALHEMPTIAAAAVVAPGADYRARRGTNSATALRRARARAAWPMPPAYGLALARTVRRYDRIARTLMTMIALRSFPP